MAREGRGLIMSNPTAGIADPYWYEWSVGLKYIIQMLNPDNGIQSVTIQSDDAQGWDDVVVEYEDKHKLYIQVKHTRDNESLTFGDLVSKDDKKEQSLLSYQAEQWKATENKEKDSFLLFSNRNFGTRKNKKRPALSEFWEHLKAYLSNNPDLSTYSFSEEFDENIHKEWFGSLSKLNTSEQFRFLSQLQIQADQPDLDELEKELIEGLAQSFGISFDQAKELLKSLDHALRRWTTTGRKKQEITCEEVYDALLNNEKEDFGDHQVNPPKPFFTSRKEFQLVIEAALKDVHNKIVFLSGLPGIGKTSLLSELIREKKTRVHLRYYTFKPISPGNDLLPADAGKTCEARNLWGALLNQLRGYFKGEFAKYKVPIRNEFIKETEQLRNEVMRLSQALAQKENERVIICIDGIDHAARANLDNLAGSQNYLDTLIPPDNIPEQVTFLIAGQPVEGYNKYPHWLRTTHPKIAKLDVSCISTEDVKLLLNDIVPPHELNGIVASIYDLTKGNTLSVIYAVEMIRLCPNTQDAFELLQERKLQDGLNVYYSQIWEYAFKQLGEFGPSLPVKVASYFSLTNARLSPDHFRLLFQDMNFARDDWSLILSRLAPLLRNENGYAVLHNDIKVFFTKIVTEGANLHIYQTCATNLIKLIFSADSLQKQRYFGITELLKKTADHSLIFRFLDSRYILEAFHQGVARSEIEWLIRFGFEEAIRTRDITRIHQMDLVVKTLQKLDSSLDSDSNGPSWSAKDYSRYQPSEMMNAPTSTCNLSLLDSVLEDILCLFQQGKDGYHDRAKYLIHNWFGDAEDIQNLTKRFEDDILDDFHPNGDRISQNFQFALRKIGRISVYHPIFHLSPQEDDITAQMIAHMNDGFEDEASTIKEDLQWCRVQSPYSRSFINSSNERMFKLIRDRKWKRLVYNTRRVPRSKFSGVIANPLFTLSILTQDQLLQRNWENTSLEELLNNLPRDRDQVFTGGEQYLCYAATAIALGLKHSHLDVWTAVGKITEKVYQENEGRIELTAVRTLLKHAFQIGLFLKEALIENKKKDFVFTNETELLRIYHELLSFQSTFIRSHANTSLAIHSLMYLLLEGIKRSDTSLKNLVSSEIQDHYSDDLVYSPFFSLLWQFLYEQGELDACKALLINIVGPNGKLWQWTSSDKFSALDELNALTRRSEFAPIIQEASANAYLHRIGFSTHKEYALFSELSWFNELVKIQPDSWETLGLSLLSFSESLPDEVDNRASYSIASAVLNAALKSNMNKGYRLWQTLLQNSRFHHSTFVDSINKDKNGILLTSNDLLVFWILACSSLYLSEYEDKKTILDIKKQILRFSSLLKLEGHEIGILKAEMEDLFPVHYHIEKLIQKESNEGSFRQRPPYTDVDQNIEWCFQQESVETDVLRQILESNVFQELNFTDKKAKATTIYHGLIQSDYKAYWSLNSAQGVYTKLFPFLTEDQKWALLQNVLSNFYSEERQYYYQFEETIEHFLLLYSKPSASALQNGLKECQKLHNNWLTGFSKEQQEPPRLVDFDHPPINAFQELCLTVLIDGLKSRQPIQITPACKGISRLILKDKVNLDFIIHNWSYWSTDQKDFLLQVFEAVIRKKPEYLQHINPILERVNKEDEFQIRAQAGIVKLAHNQVTGVGNPEIHTQPSENLSDSSIILSHPTVQIELETQNAFIGSDNHYFTSKLSLISQVMGLKEDQREYLRNRIALVLNKTALVKTKQDLSTPRRGELVLLDRQSSQILGEVLDHELSIGVLRNFDPYFIAQMLLPNDDPIHFLFEPRIHSNFDLWPDKYKRDEDLNPTNAKAIMQTGLREDEILLAAVIKTYKDKLETTARYNTSITPNIEKKECSTFNGRSVFSLYSEAYPLDCPFGNLFILGGGMSKLIQTNNYLVPNVSLFTELGMIVDSSSPSTILNNGERAIWLEKWMGPESEIGTTAHQQNEMHRWVAKANIIEPIKLALQINGLHHFFKMESTPMRVN